MSLQNGRVMIIDLLSAIPGFKMNKPQGAFYVFPDVSYYFGKTIQGKTISTASDFSMFLLEEAHVATVTGEAFGNDACIRISYAASVENIQEAVKRIAKALGLTNFYNSYPKPLDSGFFYSISKNCNQNISVL